MKEQTRSRTRAARVKKASPARDGRLTTRIPADQKELLQRAAALRGSSLTDFVLSAAREAAVATIREHDVITLSEADSRAFLDALLHPEPANETLHAAARRYRARMGDR